MSTGILGDRLRLAGEHRFVDLQRCRLQQGHVRRNAVPKLQQHDVPGDKVRRIDLRNLPVPDHRRLQAEHPFERFNGLFRLPFLGKTKHGVQEHDERDGGGTLRISDEKRDDCGDKQDEDEHAPELQQEHQEGTPSPLFFKHVLPMEPAAFLYLAGKKTGLSGIESGERLLRSHRVPWALRCGFLRCRLLLRPDHILRGSSAEMKKLAFPSGTPGICLGFVSAAADSARLQSRYALVTGAPPRIEKERFQVKIENGGRNYPLPPPFTSPYSIS